MNENENMQEIRRNVKFQALCETCGEAIGELRSLHSDAENDGQNHESVHLGHKVVTIHRDKSSIKRNPAEAYCSRGDFRGTMEQAIRHQNENRDHFIVYL